MTPAEKELWEMAHQAGWNYYKVHGVFPEKIGVHYTRYHDFFDRHIMFPILPVLSVAVMTGDDMPPSISLHMTTFAPVMGKATSANEVYVPALKNPHAVINGTQLAEIANRKEHS